MKYLSIIALFFITGCASLNPPVTASGEPVTDWDQWCSERLSNNAMLNHETDAIEQIVHHSDDINGVHQYTHSTVNVWTQEGFMLCHENSLVRGKKCEIGDIKEKFPQYNLGKEELNANK